MVSEKRMIWEAPAVEALAELIASLVLEVAGLVAVSVAKPLLAFGYFGYTPTIARVWRPKGASH